MSKGATPNLVKLCSNGYTNYFANKANIGGRYDIRVKCRSLMPQTVLIAQMGEVKCDSRVLEDATKQLPTNALSVQIAVG